MKELNDTNVLQENAPKVFVALARFLSAEQLDRLAAEYCHCVRLGGNVEPGLVRQEGASFNPRLARVLSLLTADGGIRNFTTLRAAIYAASVGEFPEALLDEVPVELLELVTNVSKNEFVQPDSVLIRGVIVLDTLRHLHQTDLSVQQRTEQLLALKEQLLGKPGEICPEWLRKKLEHAITLQMRRLDIERP
jgi:hypothetical protein